MRLLRIGEPGAERPAVERDDVWFDARAVTGDFDGQFFAGGGVERLRAGLDAGELPEVPRDAVRIGPPIARPGKVVCIGLNYRDHAEETGATPPDEPVVFMKDPSTVIGPSDQVLVPRGSVKTDWEVELGVVIGSPARYLESTEAARHFYARIVETVLVARGTREAEAAKLLENTYRHVNIALVNEMAQCFHDMGVDFWDVLRLAATKPFGFQPFVPGPGRISMIAT